MYVAPPLKDYQKRGLVSIRAMRRAIPGAPIVVAAPPGAGKSRIMEEIAIEEHVRGGRALIPTHRKMLLEQLVKGCRLRGLRVGVINADSDEYPEDSEVLIASTQTLYSRAVSRGLIDLPTCTAVLPDEAHQQQEKSARALLFGGKTENGYITEGFVERGADVIGFTGTPLGLKFYKQLVHLCNYSDLRREGMHSWIRTFGPDEIDTSRMVAKSDGSYSPRQLSMAANTIFGSVFDSYRELNPNQYPALLFGPSKDSSRWFAEQFMRQGVRAAHIDGGQIWMPEGKRLVKYSSSQDVRDELLEASRTGEVQVVCNRFVLREAIDMPWIYHSIFATVMGSPITAIQSIGRLQRSWPDYDHKILQDHGGFYWRHGSPNMDREWSIDLTQAEHIRERIVRCRKGEEREGIRCPKCGFWRMKGEVCPNCSHTHKDSVRAVRMIRGQLKEVKGMVFSGASVADKNKVWARTLFRMAYAGRSVSSAVAVFQRACEKEGLDSRTDDLRIAVPDKESLEWDLPVKDVYTWTRKAGERSR